jgi:hypothetical protein
MRRLLIAALLCLSVALPGLADAWQTVTSPEGRFSADMPGQPTITRQKHGTPVGTITENTYAVTAPEGGGYEVEYQDLPGIAILFKGQRGIVQRAKKEFLKSSHATIVSESEITIDGRKAERVTYAVPGKGQADVVFLMIGNRLYVFNAQGADTERFFGSVKVGPTVATGE